MQTLIASFPVFSMWSGLAAAPFFALFTALFMYQKWHKLPNIWKTILDHKSELAFLIWTLASCLWAEHQNFLLWSQIFLLGIGGIIISENVETISEDIFKPLIIGIAGGVICFYVEYLTHGLVSETFRIFFSKDYHFRLHFLDRGCVIMTLIFWGIFGRLWSCGKYGIALLLYCIILHMLFISDSAAGCIAFILGLIAFAMPVMLFNVMGVLIIVVSILTPVIFYYQDPNFFANITMPLSWKYRLFIWHFVAQKAWGGLVGFGLDASRHIQSDSFILDGNNFPLLPLHPHNNILQIYLETGGIGLSLFLLIIAKILLYIRKYIQSNIDTERIWGKAFLALFVNYYFIASVSFGMWQIWWVSACIFAIILIKIINIQSYRRHGSYP